MSKFTIGLLLFNAERTLQQVLVAIENNTVKINNYNAKKISSYTNIIIRKVNKIRLSIIFEKEICAKIRELNKFMTINIPPEGFIMAKCILSPNEPSLLDDVVIDIVQKVPLEKGDLNAVKTRQAIMGILTQYEPSIVNAINATCKAPFPTINTVIENIT